MNREFRTPEGIARRKIQRRNRIRKLRLNPEFKLKEKAQRVIKMSTKEERARRAAYKKSEKGRAAEARYRRGAKGQVNYWRGHLKHRYGITQETYDAMFVSQNHRCDLCGDPISKDTATSIDHNHTTGKIRGLIHQRCNTLIGLAGESKDILNMAIRYLEKHSAQ